MSKEEEETNDKSTKAGYKDHHPGYTVQNGYCDKERRLSQKCVDKYGQFAAECGMTFRNFRNCKTFWDNVQYDRFKNGIEPYLPPPEEAQDMKEYYFQKWGDNKFSRIGKPW